MLIIWPRPYLLVLFWSLKCKEGNVIREREAGDEGKDGGCETDVTVTLRGEATTKAKSKVTASNIEVWDGISSELTFPFAVSWAMDARRVKNAHQRCR